MALISKNGTLFYFHYGGLCPRVHPTLSSAIGVGRAERTLPARSRLWTI